MEEAELKQESLFKLKSIEINKLKDGSIEVMADYTRIKFATLDEALTTIGIINQQLQLFKGDD